MGSSNEGGIRIPGWAIAAVTGIVTIIIASIVTTVNVMNYADSKYLPRSEAPSAEKFVTKEEGVMIAKRRDEQIDNLVKAVSDLKDALSDHSKLPVHPGGATMMAEQNAKVMALENAQTKLESNQRWIMDRMDEQRELLSAIAAKLNVPGRTTRSRQ